MNKINENFIPDRNNIRSSFASTKAKSLDISLKKEAADFSLRYRLESSILSESLSYLGAFAEIKTYLNPVNFTKGEQVEVQGIEKPCFRFLWELMLDLYPTRPLDMVTVSIHSMRKFSVNINELLNEITNKAPSNFNRSYISLLILEEDIRAAFLNLFNSIIENEKEDFYKLQLYEIEKNLVDPSNDIFEWIEIVNAYFFSVDQENYLKTLNFSRNLSIRTSEIKQMAQVKSLLTNLEGYSNFSTTNKKVTECLVDLFKFSLVESRPPLFFEEELQNLRKRLCYGI